MNLFSRTMLAWMPLAAAISVLSVLIYAGVQQSYRQSLNDPQIQMAEDAASVLSKSDANLSTIQAAFSAAGVSFGQGSGIDIANSLAPWLVVYDDQGNPVGSNALLQGSMPKVPFGALQAAKNNAGKDTSIANENRVTWEASCASAANPACTTRQAIVVEYVPAKNTYVVGGRDMREVERREGNLSMMVFFAWLAAMIISFVFKAADVFLNDSIKRHASR